MKMHLCLFSLIPILAVSCGKPENKNDVQNSEEIATRYSINNNYEIIEAPTKEFNERISSLIFHYTATNLEKSLEVLRTGGVSAHWLIPETGRSVYKLLDENKRAYHAGISSWKRRTDLNDTSVGIEIVSLGYTCKNSSSDQCSKKEKEWKRYSSDQIKLIVQLGQDIQKRYKIDPLCVIGHSDIAIGRKFDPGPHFPWKKLAQNGVGAWVTKNEIQKQMDAIDKEIKNNISDFIIHTRLYEFGYDIRNSNYSDNLINNRLDEIYSSFKDHNSPIKSWKKVPYSSLDILNKLNDYSNVNQMDLFDKKSASFALDAFLMHYLPEVYLTNTTPDNKKILATIQALLLKYPNRAKSGCGF